MARGFRHLLHVWLSALIPILAAGTPGRAAEPAGTVAIVADIHFNPLATPELAPRLAASGPEEWPAVFGSAREHNFPLRGQDTNQALLASALAALSDKAASADLVIVTGDLLAHRFEESAAEALGASPRSDIVQALAAKTVLYVSASLRAAVPDRPILIALGNNDSACGDYQIEPGGAFLASLREMVRDFAGSERLGAEFDRTYMAGGYYAMRHPGRAQTTLLVLNDVLWSTNYRNACGTDGDESADAMMAWLERELDAARVEGRQVWLVHHIPVGIDSYATLRAPADLACQARGVPFLKEPYASRFAMLLREHAATIQANLAGHTHQDDYRLITDAGRAAGVEKIAPSISPIFGNNPGFHLFAYDKQTGDPTDFSTWFLANLDQASTANPGEWRREYIFTEAYGELSYSAAAVERIRDAMLGDGTIGESIRSNFRRFYQVGGGEIAPGTLSAYACSFGNLDPASLASCYCDK